MAGNEGSPGRLVIVLANAYQHKIGPAIDRPKALEIRQRVAAGSAPGSPEVQQHNFATKFWEWAARGCRRRSMGAGSAGFGRRQVLGINSTRYIIVIENHFRDFGGGFVVALFLGASQACKFSNRQRLVARVGGSSGL